MVMVNNEVEIREAIDAGERALRSLKRAKDSLSSARNWGLFDILGGKSLSGLMKHVKIGDAKESLNQAKYDLERFSRELSDVQDIPDLTIDIGNLLTFADFFFDGLLSDMMVQSRIKQAQENVDAAIGNVENLLGRLRAYGR